MLWVLRWDTQVFGLVMEGHAEKQKVFLQTSLKEKTTLQFLLVITAGGKRSTMKLVRLSPRMPT